MVDPNTRQGKRTPVTLKIKFKSETLEQFIERYAVDVSQGGIFIRTKEPLAVGTQMKFEFQLRDASPLIAGEGTVVWTRENDPSRPAIAPGMGVRFDRLADGSQSVLERILAEKAKQAPQRPLKETTKPPLFTDSPTRVAPAPLQEALLGDRNGASPLPRTRADSQETPLPKPMPFHSDADDFSEEAFEEATKVRALDELVAQTAIDGNTNGLAGLGMKPPAPAPVAPPAPISDELAARRAAQSEPGPTTAGMPVGVVPPFAQEAPQPIPADARTPDAHERDSAPGLPSPPEATRGSKPKVLDTTPSPREASPSTPPANRTRIGLDPAPARITGQQTPIKDKVTVPSGVHAIVPPTLGELEHRAQSPVPVAKRPSVVPIVLGIIFVVAAAGAALWFFVLREPAIDGQKDTKALGSGSAATTTPAPGSGSSAVVTNTGSGSGAVGSGSAAAMIKAPDGSGSGSAEKPAGPVVDTVIASAVDKAMIEVEGTDMKGLAPLTAKLEKDKTYKVKLTAAGYLPTEIDVKGGQAKVTQKLEAKKYTVTINATPAGAAIAVDGVMGKSPFDLKTAPKKAVHVRVAKGGYKTVEIVIAADKWTEDATSMTFAQDVTLAVAPIVQQPQTPPTPPTGPVTTPPDGSATPPTPPPPPPETPPATPPPAPPADPAPATP